MNRITFDFVSPVQFVSAKQTLKRFNKNRSRSLDQFRNFRMRHALCDGQRHDYNPKTNSRIYGTVMV